MKIREKVAERWSSNSEWLVALTINVQLEVVRKLWDIKKIWSGGQSSGKQTVDTVTAKLHLQVSHVTPVPACEESWAELHLNVNCN